MCLEVKMGENSFFDYETKRMVLLSTTWRNHPIPFLLYFLPFQPRSNCSCVGAQPVGPLSTFWLIPFRNALNIAYLHSLVMVSALETDQPSQSVRGEETIREEN